MTLIKKCLTYIAVSAEIAIIGILPISSFSEEIKYPYQNPECTRLYEKYEERSGYWIERLHALEAELKLNKYFDNYWVPIDKLQAELRLNEDEFIKERIRNVKMALRYLTNHLLSEAAKNNCSQEGFKSIESIVGN